MIECPKCKSTKISEIISEGNLPEFNTKGTRDLDLYPIRPAIKFECEKCTHTWENPEYIRYLLNRSVK